MEMVRPTGRDSLVRILVVVTAILSLVLVDAACTSLTTSNTDNAPRWSWLGESNTATQGGQVTAVSCASSSLCVAVGAYNPEGNPGQVGNSVTVFKGNRWSQSTVLGQKWKGCITHYVCALQGYGLYLISCAPPRFCMTMDTASKSFVYDGKQWKEIPQNFGLPPAIYQYIGTSLSCPSRDFCMAVSNIDITDTFDGSTWGVPERAFAGNVDPAGVWCRNAHFCIVGGLPGFSYYTYNGTSWSKVGTSAPTGFPKSWSCLLVSDCEFSNGFTVPLDSIGADVLSCATKTFCMAVSPTSYSEYNGSRWSKPDAMPHEQLLNLYSSAPGGQPNAPSLSCVSSHFCLLVAAGGATWVWQ